MKEDDVWEVDGESITIEECIELKKAERKRRKEALVKIMLEAVTAASMIEMPEKEYQQACKELGFDGDMTWDDTIYEFARTHKYFNKKQLTTEITKSINQAMLAHWSAL